MCEFTADRPYHCIGCNKHFKASSFIVKTSLCKQCTVKAKFGDACFICDVCGKEVKRSNVPSGQTCKTCNPAGAFVYNKRQAKVRNKKFELTYDEFVTMFRVPCTYCGDTATGLDRIDSNKGYVFENVVPSCFTCNRAKNALSYSDFMALVYSIKCEYPKPHNVVVDHERAARLVQKDKMRCWQRVYRSDGMLTYEQIVTFIGVPCTYCGCSDTGGGIDRIDSRRGYELDNITPCCPSCNTFKSDLTVEDFFNHVIKIRNHTERSL